MFLAVVIRHKHERVCDDCPRYASRKSSPESKQPPFIPVNELCAVDHPTIRYERVVLFEGQRYLTYLELSLDYVLRVGNKPGEETPDTPGYQLRTQSKVVGAVQFIKLYKGLLCAIISCELSSVTRRFPRKS